MSGSPAQSLSSAELDCTVCRGCSQNLGAGACAPFAKRVILKSTHRCLPSCCMAFCSPFRKPFPVPKIPKTLNSVRICLWCVLRASCLSGQQAAPSQGSATAAAAAGGPAQRRQGGGPPGALPAECPPSTTSSPLLPPGSPPHSALASLPSLRRPYPQRPEPLPDRTLYPAR